MAAIRKFADVIGAEAKHGHKTRSLGRLVSRYISHGDDESWTLRSVYGKTSERVGCFFPRQSASLGWAVLCGVDGERERKSWHGMAVASGMGIRDSEFPFRILDPPLLEV